MRYTFPDPKKQSEAYVRNRISGNFVNRYSSVLDDNEKWANSFASGGALIQKKLNSVIDEIPVLKRWEHRKIQNYLIANYKQMYKAGPGLHAMHCWKEHISVHEQFKSSSNEMLWESHIKYIARIECIVNDIIVDDNYLNILMSPEKHLYPFIKKHIKQREYKKFAADSMQIKANRGMRTSIWKIPEDIQETVDMLTETIVKNYIGLCKKILIKADIRAIYR